MPDTVHLPIFGNMKKKTALWAGVGVGGLGLVFYIRQRRASSGSGGSSGTPAATTGQIDPATGYPYGSAEDQAALANAQGAGSPYNTSQLGNGLGGYYYGNGGVTQPTPPGPGNFADNAEWAQYAENYMINTLQADPATVGNALGKYLTGQPVDSSMQSIIEEAIAIAGHPPTSGPGGYPPNINLGGHRPPPPPHGNQVPVPNIVGYPAGEAFNVIKAAQLSPHEDSAAIRPNWTVTAQSPRAGTKVNIGTKVSYNAKAPGHGGPPPPHPNQVTVPNLVGQTAGSAFNVTRRLGLKLINPKHGQKGEPKKRVRSQSPRAGTRVNKGSSVTIGT